MFLTRIYVWLMAITIAVSPAGALERAPELSKVDAWINTDQSLKLSALKGKVVLVDFWAFDCDPCKETIPRIEALHEKYSKDGLVVIGVHTPRTDDEKQIPKLRVAIKNFGIRYPVAVDSKQKIFQDYRCDLWPSQFVIDKKGFIRLNHGGIGRYEEIEAAIQAALNEN